VDVAVTGLPVPQTTAQLRHFRIDAAHSNSFETWKQLGSPAQPSRDEYALLEKAGRLAELDPARQIEVKGGTVNVQFTLPRQAVSLLVVQW
jgi:xylan 1,4-beta-xylosidase